MVRLILDKELFLVELVVSLETREDIYLFGVFEVKVTFS